MSSKYGQSVSNNLKIQLKDQSRTWKKVDYVKDDIVYEDNLLQIKITVTMTFIMTKYFQSTKSFQVTSFFFFLSLLSNCLNFQYHRQRRVIAM